jgi:transmembrane sensor
MNGDPSDPDPDPDAVAACRYARLRSGRMTEAEHGALAAWRLANPGHAAAWARVDGLWRAMGDVGDDPAILALREAARSRAPMSEPVRWRSYAGIAAAAALVIGLSTMLPRLHAPTPAAAIAYAQPREIVTARGQQARLDLEDGSTIMIAPQSRVLIGPWDTERRVTLVSGEAYFKVAHATQRFVVHAGGASVTAVGTDFTVARDGGDVRTMLEHGRIRVVPDERSAAGTLVEAGHALTIRNGGIVTQRAVDPVAETDWMRGELVFAGTPMSAAVARYNRYAARPVRIDGERLARTPVTGRFLIGGPSGFVGMMAAAGIVRVARDDPDGIVLAAPSR